jgi:hypothetical protein
MSQKKEKENVLGAELSPVWGIRVDAQMLSALSGSKADDIDPMLRNSELESILNELKLKKAKTIIESKDATPEEIELAILELQNMQNTWIKYKAPLNVLWRDNQADKPYPIIPQHFFIGAFRDTISEMFPELFNMFIRGSGKETKAESSKGAGKKHTRKQIQVFPVHIPMFRDPEHKIRIEEKDIKIEGQQPVEGGPGGFARYEVIEPPIYFRFNMIFQPNGKIKNLNDINLVTQALKVAAFRGLGGRRASNYGIWKFNDVTDLNLKGIDDVWNRAILAS